MCGRNKDKFGVFYIKINVINMLLTSFLEGEHKRKNWDFSTSQLNVGLHSKFWVLFFFSF